MDGDRAKSTTKRQYVVKLRWRNATTMFSAIVILCSVFVARAAPTESDDSENRSGRKWIQHRVTSGERLREISDHYLVSMDKIIGWNDLDSEHPWLRVGQKLKIFSKVEPLVRHKITHVVKRGDSWSRIAERYNVDQRRLRRYWNPRVTDPLKRGQKIVIWAEPEPEPDPEPQIPEVEEKDQKEKIVEQGEAEPFTVIAVQENGQSVGRPGRGRLRHGVQLPENRRLYTRRNPIHSWGSSLMVKNLQQAIANFRRDTGFDREIVICDMSLKRGGRIRPHHSHRSGRDVDIRLPLRKGQPPGTVPDNISQVDWKAAWALVRALILTKKIKYMFLERNRQRELHKEAEAAGASARALEKIFQYPRRDKRSMIRHARGHINHIHVRFVCGENEPECSD